MDCFARRYNPHLRHGNPLRNKTKEGLNNILTKKEIHFQSYFKFVQQIMYIKAYLQIVFDKNIVFLH